MVEIYQDFHANPELSFQEEKTAAGLSEQWQAIDAEVTTGVGGHSVVGLLRNGDGPVLMLRTDMDALPITEKTGLEFASTVKTTGTSGNKDRFWSTKRNFVINWLCSREKILTKRSKQWLMKK